MVVMALLVLLTALVVAAVVPPVGAEHGLLAVTDLSALLTEVALVAVVALPAVVVAAGGTSAHLQ